jgi:lysophospholipase L1-like esterase
LGSSTIDRWDSIHTDLPGVDAIEEGLNDTTYEWVLKVAADKVRDSRPDKAVLYSGDNDLKEGVSPERVVELIEQTIRSIHDVNRRIPIFIISIKPSPDRAVLLETMLLTNELIRQSVAQLPFVHFVDVCSPMLDRLGRPRPELFASDHLHLNHQGYQLWAEILTEELKTP